MRVSMTTFLARTLAIGSAFLALSAAEALAVPGGGSGPITIDSSTFVAGSSVMGTDGGVYSDGLPPVASTTTAAFRMTKYRAQHVNLRDSSGVEVGTVGNPIHTSESVTVNISTVQVTNSSFSVTGSTVYVQGTVGVTTASPISVTGSTVSFTPGSSLSVTGSTVNVGGSVSIGSSIPLSVTGSTVNINGAVSVTGSSVTIGGGNVNVTNSGFNVVNVATVTISGTPTVTVGSALPVGTNNIGTVTGSTVVVTNTVNTKSVSVSTVIVSAMPAVNVFVTTVTITNSSFSIVGVSSVNVVNIPSVSLSAPLPAGGNQIGLVTGSTVTITNPSFSITGNPNVNVLSQPNAVSTNPSTFRASVSVDGASNTVQAIQSGSWTDTVQQTNPANLKAAVYIASSSNTVTVSNSSFSITGSTVNVNINGTVPVSGTFWQGTQPVSQIGTWSTTSVNLSTVTYNGISQPIYQTQLATVTFNGSAQPVTAAQTGTWNVNNTSVNVATVTISGTPSVNATIVNIPTTTVSGTVTVTGSTITANQGGTWTVGISTGTNVIGKVNFATPTTTVFSSTTINTTTTGDNTIVAGISSQTVRVFRMFFVVSAATTITFKDGSTGMTGAMTFNAGGAFILDFQGDPWFVTTASNGFVINQSGTAQISGRVYWTQS